MILTVKALQDWLVALLVVTGDANYDGKSFSTPVIEKY